MWYLFGKENVNFFKIFLKKIPESPEKLRALM